jgi:hypothetical protein
MIANGRTVTHLHAVWIELPRVRDTTRFFHLDQTSSQSLELVEDWQKRFRHRLRRDKKGINIGVAASNQIEQSLANRSQS